MDLKRGTLLVFKRLWDFIVDDFFSKSTAMSTSWAYRNRDSECGNSTSFEGIFNGFEYDFGAYHRCIACEIYSNKK